MPAAVWRALGAHPRLAAMMLAARTPSEAALAADLAALLEERDPLRRPDAPADIGLRLAATHRWRSRRRSWCAVAHPPDGRAAIADGCGPTRRADGDAGRLLAAAFPDRIAQRRGEPGSFRLAGGGGARLPRADPFASAPLLAVAALELKASARIRLAAPLDPDALPAARITEQVETSFDPVSGAVLARRRRRLGALVLTDRTEPADPAEVAAALARAVAAEDLRPLPWTDAARQLQARVALMRRLEPDAGWPDLSDAALAIGAQEWLAPRLGGMSRLADLARLDLHAILRGLLPWDLGRRLDAALPAQLALHGTRAAIDYTQPVPVASARAQAFYGVTAIADPGGWPRAIAARAAVAGGPAGRDYRRPCRLLARRLGRCTARHAGALSEARLAGGSVAAGKRAGR